MKFKVNAFFVNKCDRDQAGQVKRYFVNGQVPPDEPKYFVGL